MHTHMTCGQIGLIFLSCTLVSLTKAQNGQPRPNVFPPNQMNPMFVNGNRGQIEVQRGGVFEQEPPQQPLGVDMMNLGPGHDFNRQNPDGRPQFQVPQPQPQPQQPQVQQSQLQQPQQSPQLSPQQMSTHALISNQQQQLREQARLIDIQNRHLNERNRAPSNNFAQHPHVTVVQQPMPVVIVPTMHAIQGQDGKVQVVSTGHTEKSTNETEAAESTRTESHSGRIRSRRKPSRHPAVQSIIETDKSSEEMIVVTTASPTTTTTEASSNIGKRDCLTGDCSVGLVDEPRCHGKQCQAGFANTKHNKRALPSATVWPDQNTAPAVKPGRQARDAEKPITVIAEKTSSSTSDIVCQLNNIAKVSDCIQNHPWKEIVKQPINCDSSNRQWRCYCGFFDDE